RGQNWPRMTIPPGVRELEADRQVRLVPDRVPVGLTAVGDQSGERVAVGFVEPKLSRRRPAFLGDGTRLAPNQFGTAGPETDVTAIGQFAGRPIQVAIAPFHGVDAPAVADG